MALVYCALVASRRGATRCCPLDSRLPSAWFRALPAFRRACIPWAAQAWRSLVDVIVARS